MYEIEDPGQVQVEEAAALATDAIFSIGRLFLEGNGQFCNCKGDTVPVHDVLREHHRMCEALRRIKAKLEVAQSLTRTVK